MCGTFAWLVSGNAVWPIGSGGGGWATNGSIGGSDLLGSYNLCGNDPFAREDVTDLATP
jgi:hypothetical protein